MDPSGSVALGVMGVLLGLAFIGLALLLIRAIARVQPVMSGPAGTTQSVEGKESGEAALLVQSGGRVLYANPLARELFGILEEDLNLERLARRARPSEQFIDLCASERQSRLTINGVFVEAESHYLPYGGSTASLVTFRHPQIADLSGDPVLERTAHTIDLMSELSQAIASSLDLETTLSSILESVEKLIPADLSELTIWDADQTVLIPYRFSGPAGTDRHLEKCSHRYSPQEGYSGYLVQHQQHLYVNDIHTFQEIKPAVDHRLYPFRAFMGFPLLFAGQLVGTLELSALMPNFFSINDLEELRVISRQAAVAVHNAMIYEAEQRRVMELTGLAQLAQAASSLNDPKNLFQQLVESIRPLFQVEVIGFWIYDEIAHTLEARVPFLGIPEQFFEFESYIVSILPESPAESILNSQETILAAKAQEDEKLSTIGLVGLMQAAGVDQTILAPLASGGRLIGYLQVGDKLDGAPFDSNDLRILTIAAGQAAMIIENANLVQQTQRRAQRSEALRRIASLTGSPATLDEILQFSLRELARLLQADLGAIFLLDENLGELKVHKASLFGISEEVCGQLPRIAIPTRPSNPANTRACLTTSAIGDPDFFAQYRPFVEITQARSAIDAPLIAHERYLGKLLLASCTAGFFDQSDLTTIDTAAGQLAGAVDRASLSTQTDDTLRRRVEQLTAVNRISRELNTSLDLEYLLQHVYAEVIRTTRAQCGSILLFQHGDQPAKQTSIIIGIGDEHDKNLLPQEMLVLEKEEPVIVHYPDASNDQAPHEGIVSSMIVPIVYEDEVAGIFHLHTSNPDCFDATALEISQTLAVQAAIALGNAQRYQEQVRRNELLSRRVETLGNLMETTRELQSKQTLDAALEDVAYGIQESTPFNVIEISVYEAKTGSLIRAAQAGISLPQWEEARQEQQDWESIQHLLLPEFRIGRSYFIPGDLTPLIPDEIHYRYAQSFHQHPAKNSTWSPGDALLIPLVDASGAPLGLIRTSDPRDGLRPDRPTLETLDIYANQASLTIESQLRLKELSDLSQSLQGDLNRIQKATEATKDHLPILLHKDLEQTLTIQSLSQRVKRIRAGLDIAEIVNRQPDPSSVLNALGRGILTRMGFDTVLISDNSSGNPRLMQSLGSLPSGANLEALFGQRNPLHQCLNNNENLFLANLNDHPEWKSSPLLQALDARGLICLAIPTEMGKNIPPQVEAAVLAVKHSPGLTISKEDEQIYLLLARQTAIALQNLRLLSETTRRLQEVNLLLEFSRQLGSLDPLSILDSLVHSAMRALPAANSCLVALWDQSQGCLAPKAAAGYQDRQSILDIRYHPGVGLPGQVYQTGEPIRLAEVDFAQHYHLPSEDLLHYRKATEGRLPISVLAVPIGGSQPGDQPELRTSAPLGVILLENFKDTTAFSQEDQALITSLAQQTALTLENARLYQASEERANQLRALTNLAATITSSLQSDELIASLLDQAKTIIPYDTGTLWLKQENTLIIRAARGFMDSENRIGITAAVEDSQLIKAMIETRQPIYVADVREDARFPALIEPEYLSWLGVPLISKGTVIGVIALEKVEAGFYTREHIQAVMTFAGQAAVALENANLYEESLGRAQELDRRSQRLVLLNRFSTELSGSLDSAYILKVTCQKILEAVHCTEVSAVIFDNDNQPVVEVEMPSVSPALPIHLPEAPLFDRVKESLGAFNSEELYNSQGELISPLLLPLKDYFSACQTRALLALPLATGNELHGILLIHNREPVRFSQDEIELARTISNQAAVAVQNASLFGETQRLFAETRQRSAELASLFNLGMQLSQVLEYQDLVDTTFGNIFDLLKVDSVMLVVRNANGTLQAQAIDHGQILGPVQIPETAGSLSQHVLTTGKPLLIGDLQNDPLPVPGYVVGDPSRSWMGVPLIIRGVATGVLAVQSDTPGSFSETELRMIAQAGNQLAIALDNARLFSEVQNYAVGLEQRVDERTAQLAKEHQRSQTLLGIITELSASLDMDLVLIRTLGLINESTASEHSIILLKDPDDGKLFIRAARGRDSEEATSPKFSLELAAQVVKQRQPELIADLETDERWAHILGEKDHYHSALAVPLMMGEDALGVLMLLHDQPGRFSPDLLDLIQATAKQIAVAINNSQLFGLIRDQAQHLGDMLRRQHIETSRSQAILEAVADGVLVTDSHREITLFNASAERILGVDRGQVLGRSLEHFSGLFGKAGQTWIETIHHWSESPASLGSTDTTVGHTEQIELDDQRVVLVSLSPVRLRKDFLGTVSIFRDITHQVEVDRLKSEFVATVSHELRTPMTSIKGYVEILLMGAAGKLNEQQTHFLEIVKSNTERLAILVNDLLDISRIEAGKVTLSIQPIDLREIAREAVDTLIQRSKDEDKPMDIHIQLPKDLERVSGDADRVRQVVDNLLENAYLYTPEHGRILLCIHRVSGEMQIDVQDNGIGISPQDQEHIFERFYRGEDPLVLASSGTGLGLSIVSRIVEMHKGRIWVSSKGIPGEGSTFSFTLPVYQPEAEMARL